MNRYVKPAALIAALLVVAGCAAHEPAEPFGGPRGPGRFGGEDEFRAAAEREQALIAHTLGAYDADDDGAISTAECDSGLQRDFARADLDGDGLVSGGEIEMENQRRWRADGTGTSPLIDWNQDGAVDLAEFSGSTRSLFAQLDRDRDGTVSADEMRTPPMRAGPPGGPGGFGRRGGRGPRGPGPDLGSLPG